MEFFLVYDNEGILRIEEYNGAAITLYIDSGVARILSLNVPRQYRRHEIGSGLLKAAEKEAFARGAVTVECDYDGSIPGMTEYFEKAGYKTSSNMSVFSFDTGYVMTLPKVQALMKNSFKDTEFLTLEELKDKKRELLVRIMNHMYAKLGTTELGRFSQKLSGVVFDSEWNIRSFILCTDRDNSLHIHFVGASGSADEDYDMAAIAGMLRQLNAMGGYRKCMGITMLCAQKSTLKLIRGLLSKMPEVSKVAMYAVRTLKEDELSDIPVTDDIDIYSINEWRREIVSVPLQYNICWKAVWRREIRNKQRG